MIDLLILTHLPSFYKVNLYNELASRLKVHVVFLGDHSLIRADDFISHDFKFTATYLSKGPFEQRAKLKTLFRLMALLVRSKYRKLIVGGWEHPEFWLAVLASAKSKNYLCLESGIESQTTGLKAMVKRLFLSRVGGILASGAPQRMVAKHLSFSRTILTTGGVGIFSHQKPTEPATAFKGRFLYVGRLSPEKNINRLVQAFKQRPQFQLTIVGQGPIQVEACANIRVLGYVEQSELPAIYQSHDVLVLPSLQEPWGLVVEEAIYHQLPVLVSDKVGAKELVEDLKVGKVFNPHSLNSLLKGIDLISQEDTYQGLKTNLQQPVIELAQRKQVDTYLSVL